jgi:HD-GYP domain-containing protein (c-di-GMP phosphodiesterase class II)
MDVRYEGSYRSAMIRHMTTIAPSATEADDRVDLLDALHALAFMGDLSMGQPADHSPRVAMLALKLAKSIKLDATLCWDTTQVALLRWSGCTANATKVSETIGDDVAGRAAMLSLQIDQVDILVAPRLIRDRVAEISAIHCEVSSIVAQTLALRPVVAASLACVFEHWDGSGEPEGRVRSDIPLPAQVVSVASELEIFSRMFGMDSAIRMLLARAGSVHAHELVDVAIANASTWMTSIAQGETAGAEITAGNLRQTAPLTLVADVIDLKLPWLTGYSRATSALAGRIASRISLSPIQCGRVRRAGLLQGLGRVAIPNAIWNKPGSLSEADWERVRLSPYWTSRSAKSFRNLEEEVAIASHVRERLDGTGYFRGTRQANTPLDYRILPVVTAFLSLQADRPWRRLLTRGDAMALLLDHARRGQFDTSVVEALGDASDPAFEGGPRAVNASDALSPREADVLKRISLGDSNKEAAVRLGISPSTVRTHMESVFRKLACNSRAAATLRASMLGLI